MIVERARGAELAADARIERTWLRLSQAVLSLAAERDIATVSVAELSRRAGIHRATFYDHAETPVALLTRVLAIDLDAVRVRSMTQLDRAGLLLRDLTRTTMAEIIDHVLTHEGVYGGAGRASSLYALRVVLAEHVEQSVLTVLREGFAIPPTPGPDAARLHAAFIAHGITGAVEAWLRLPRPRDPDLLLAAVEASYPAWYAPPAADPEVRPGPILNSSTGET
ncbi:MAG: TetR/AcrR family transcriptional regulator [Sphingomonas taxi]|uniref:TetR/AcrR family transcriptional regulator n=1 Tax=Sphingomonas taxi TaxID=1549858 RepID=A0A2W5R756_9SPHN|nr:MAG: TetR/AcrR family transcriptional regulator [Sphingomonas taxi]